MVNIVCIGAGYVGSVTAAAFSNVGHFVTVIDLDPQKLEAIQSRMSPIFEPGLEALIEQADHLLNASASYQPVRQANAVFICVGTPSLPDASADMSYVKAAARSIGENLNPSSFTVIVNKSTVPVGTTDLVSMIIEEASGLKSNQHFAVVSNPEFLREGYALEDVFYPDRIVIGTKNEKAKMILRELYGPFIERKYEGRIYELIPNKTPRREKITKYMETDEKSAEMIKYASNAFLAVKISYINEIARLSEALGSNIEDIAKGMGLDQRIGEKFLQVSSGWSGSCFPKDTSELLLTSHKYGRELKIVKAATESNHDMLLYCVQKVQRKLKCLNGKTLSILGLTFKPDTDDVRQTQALTVISKLLEFGAHVKVHDPKGMDGFKHIHKQLDIHYCRTAEEAAVQSSAIILLTHWTQYRDLDWRNMYKTMVYPYILDTRNFLINDQLCEIGFDYEGIGK